MKDRRRLTRYHLREYFPVVDRKSKTVIGGLANLSIEGAKIVTQEAIEKHTTLHCTVELPENVLGRNTIEFDAECRWCKKSRTTGLYESGYRLTNVSMTDQTTIMCLVLEMISDRLASRTTVEIA